MATAGCRGGTPRGAIEEYNTYDAKLHDAVGGNRAYIFFDKGWLET